MKYALATIMMAFVASTSLTGTSIVGAWNSADRSATLDLSEDGEANYTRASINAVGTWKRVREGEYEGTIAVSLMTKQGTRFTLYFQQDGRRLLGVNTARVDGVNIPDDTHIAVTD